MEIEEAKELKKELEHEIFNFVSDKTKQFELDTGLDIDLVDLKMIDHTSIGNKQCTILTSVEISVKI